MSVFEEPYIDHCATIFGRDDAYSILVNKKIIEFKPTSFLRGINIRDSIIIVDEAQNLNFHELSSIITRLDDMSKIVFCGDIRQSDLRGNIKKEYLNFKEVIKLMGPKYFTVIDMKIDDIVRSEMVKDFIIACEKFNDRS